ncbi:DNA/RNA non-specific endonuclease [Dawidia soli]|uniref:DNA/RNA non-specific endonuclease n=1 Tax=Dawidia soli TaxID=2782352 RepID=A0AAP2GLD1_9BACT|nr:DNA/RNA non-specific endonuclease [Dawidia soli]MBT1690485.1 DNA/RNA non-specific endonuclease [Dawidia soli]
MKRFILFAVVIALPGVQHPGNAQQLFSNLSASEKKLYREHVVGGQPDGNVPVYVRQGYVMRYNATYRIPEWVCYHIEKDYLKGPKREKRFSAFKTDIDTPDPVRTSDYTGTNYARGHMAPFFAMGGDRDGNSRYSNAEDIHKDPYDDETVYQANYMSNICPQDQDALNGAGGPWYKLETFIRKDLVGGRRSKELNVYAGAIVSNPDQCKILTNKHGATGIAIPDKFYQILIYQDKKTGDYITGAFLFPHVTSKKDLPSKDLFDYMVPVDSIEKETDLDFLHALSAAKQKKTESKTNRDFWEALASD